MLGIVIDIDGDDKLPNWAKLQKSPIRAFEDWMRTLWCVVCLNNASVELAHVNYHDPRYQQHEHHGALTRKRV
jgi:hypothetical protein